MALSLFKNRIREFANNLNSQYDCKPISNINQFINLFSESPSALADCTHDEVTMHSVTITCSPGDDVGLALTYVIEVSAPSHLEFRVL